MVRDIPLLMCVGATKCGTSWLYDYFRQHPECALRAVKELRYFTAIDWDERATQAKIIADRIATQDKRIAEAGADVPVWMRRAHKDLSDWHPVIAGGDSDAYLNYLFDVRDTAKLVGDISPEYSRLSADRMRDLAGLTGDVRFLYVIRDPMDRFWSHVRMTARDRARWYGTDDADQRAVRIARRTIAEAGDLEIVESGAYGRNIAKLTGIEGSQVKVMFYEELFTDDAMREICEFLGISFKPGNYGREVFKGEGMAFPSDLKTEAFAYLKPEYAAAEAHMGRLPQNWIEMRDAMS